ncbi:hypothetical protein SB2_24575 [Methylobacterium radiotolerans]|nr:hypothetical protein SB3_25555 [Methylobacterium radiotolerans]KTS44370.1 hypothetical protein SB2_24575 [Methylobacterium radiotolerans]
MRSHYHDGHLLAVSSAVSITDPTTVIVAGRTAEIHAEKILADIPDGGVILWCTPPHNSFVGELLVRRLFTDGDDLQWGPPLSIEDRPGIDARIGDLSRKLGSA